jgi:peptidoglycan hydrolase-like protein with peptidoglycan-binding domain
VSAQYPTELRIGDQSIYVREFQYFLNVLGENLEVIPEVAIDGVFGPATEAAVRAFQQAYGLPVTGIVDEETWSQLYNVYRGIVNSSPGYYSADPTALYPGFLLLFGIQGPEVRTLQEYLLKLSEIYTEIPPVSVNGIFGTATRDAVIAFQNLFGLNPTGIVDALTWDAIADAYSDIYYGETAAEGQFAGNTLGGGAV